MTTIHGMVDALMFALGLAFLLGLCAMTVTIGVGIGLKFLRD